MSEHAPTERIGGPGASHENRQEREKSRAARPRPEESKSDKRTGISGGGGERDSHHTHDPGLKGGRS
jgi:hypothetical protein